MDCDLQRREDRSLMEVYIAVPLLQQLTVILRLHRAKRRRTRELAAGYGYEREGQRFHDVTRLAKHSRFESEESLESLPPTVQLVPPRITVDEVVTREERRHTTELPPMPRVIEERGSERREVNVQQQVKTMRISGEKIRNSKMASILIQFPNWFKFGLNRFCLG